MTVYEQIAELQRQRDQVNADFEAKLTALRAQGSAELEAARRQVAVLESALTGQVHVSQVQVTVPAEIRSAPRLGPANPLDETDFGMGVTESGGNGRATYQEFTDELAELRGRAAERRARRA